MDMEQDAKMLADNSKVFFAIIRFPDDSLVVSLKGNEQDLVNTVCSVLAQDRDLYYFLDECLDIVRKGPMPSSVPMGKGGEA